MEHSSGAYAILSSERSRKRDQVRDAVELRRVSKMQAHRHNNKARQKAAKRRGHQRSRTRSAEPRSLGEGRWLYLQLAQEPMSPANPTSAKPRTSWTSGKEAL